MAKFCKHCGSELKEGKKFCAKCGTPTGAAESAPPVPAAWVCPACGHENAKGKFCAKCGGGKPEENAAAPTETPAPSPIEKAEASTPPVLPPEASVAAPPLPEPPAPAPTEAVPNSFEAPPAQAPKARNNKTIILIVTLIVVAVAAFFGSSTLTESLYASKVEECASIMTESKTLLDSLAELPADAASDDVKKVAADLAKNAEKLNSIRGGLIGKLPKKPPQRKGLGSDWKERGAAFQGNCHGAIAGARLYPFEH